MLQTTCKSGRLYFTLAGKCCPLKKAFLVLPILAPMLGWTPAHAQWTDQIVTLRPGWNAVFLEVQPEPQEVDAALAGIAVESVWMWNRHFSSVQFVQDPNELLPGDPDWLTYVPPSSPSRSLMNLYSLLGGRSYLIKLSNSASSVSWTIHGRPVPRPTGWLADSMNYVGFSVDPNSPPTFQSFFAPSPAHAGQPIYRLVNGFWQRTTDGTMRSGEAFWIMCSGPSAYSGPITLDFEQGTGLDYGITLMEQPLRIKNLSTTARAITIRSLASAQPAASGFPALGGDVPLSYWYMDASRNQYEWIPFSAPLSITLLPGAEWPLRLAVRRRDVAPYTGPVGPEGVLYQSIMDITDGAGSHRLLPITAKALESASAAGLWIGSAVIDHVNRPASIASSSFLSAGNFLDTSNLIQKLQTTNPALSQFLWTNFSLAARQVLTNGTNTVQEQNSALADELNFILQRTNSIYSLALFAGVALSQETSNLQAMVPPVQGQQLIRLNRLLMEDAYTNNIQRSVYIDPTALLKTASSFQFRLIVHVDSNGVAKLLQNVTLMWKNGTYTNAINGAQVVDLPGRYVLLTSNQLTYRFSGAVLQNGEPVPRRFSAPAFGFSSPTNLTGVFGVSNGVTTVLDFDDRLNPFKHLYHPQHDNLTARFEPAGIGTNAYGLRYATNIGPPESFSIRRDIRFQFTDTDPEGLALAGWGDSQVGGIYGETITGLHKDALLVQGKFRLHRVSTVGVLNDGIVEGP